MATLDVSPMMTALRTNPEEFEVRHGWLRHVPSRHDFSFDQEGGVQIRAECNCSHLAIRSEQARQLTDCYKEWQVNYWQPLLINREFASHFQRSPLRRMLINWVGWLHQRLLQQSHHDHHYGEVSAMHPAE